MRITPDDGCGDQEKGCRDKTFAVTGILASGAGFWSNLPGIHDFLRGTQ